MCSKPLTALHCCDIVFFLSVQNIKLLRELHTAAGRSAACDCSQGCIGLHLIICLPLFMLSISSVIYCVFLCANLFMWQFPCLCGQQWCRQGSGAQNKSLPVECHSLIQFAVVVTGLRDAVAKPVPFRSFLFFLLSDIS